MHCLFFLILLSTLASSSSLVQKRSTGTAVFFSDFPYAVLVLGTNSTGDVQISCSGSILSSPTQELSFVLTTATCVSVPGLSYTVLVPNDAGDLDFGGNSWDNYNVSVISPSPNSSLTQPFNLTFNNLRFLVNLSSYNVAVLSLATPITTPTASSVDLSSTTSVPSNTSITILGYGLPALYTLTAMQAPRTIQPNASNPASNRFLFVSSNVSSISVLSGDQGGPWIVSGQQIALSESIILGNSTQRYSIGILVAPHMNFINTVLNGEVPAPGTAPVSVPGTAPVSAPVDVPLPVDTPVDPPVTLTSEATHFQTCFALILICLALMF